MNVETNLDALCNTVARTMHDTFKREIRAKLMQMASSVVDEVAEEIAKELTLKVDHVVSGPSIKNPFDGDIRVFLRVNEKDEKSYSIKKTVVES